MNTEQTARLVSLLTAEEWTRRQRNSAARIVADGKEDDRIISVNETINGRYRRNRAMLLSAVAEALGCACQTNTEGYEYQGKRLRYIVHLVGHESDIRVSRILYEALLAHILGQVSQINGDDVLQRRRDLFLGTVDRVSIRMKDVTSVPSCSWVPAHHREAVQLARESA